ncbi:hypothetical protein K501DRAFT_276745 [Backusella circina FSU 941]|nr:hypothetical protein K501DRAFT_276745 [Backusella circina FSU 941]
MPLTGLLAFTLDENQSLSSSIPNLIDHQIQTLDVAVQQYNILYSIVEFRKNLDKAMKCLSFHNIYIDKEDPNYIQSLLIAVYISFQAVENLFISTLTPPELFSVLIDSVKLTPSTETKTEQKKHLFSEYTLESHRKSDLFLLTEAN